MCRYELGATYGLEEEEPMEEEEGVEKEGRACPERLPGFYAIVYFPKVCVASARCHSLQKAHGSTLRPWAIDGLGRRRERKGFARLILSHLALSGLILSYLVVSCRSL